MQVMETYSPDKSQPDLITHVNVEAAHASDAQALLPPLDDVQARELSSTELLADSLYGGDENVEKAEKRGVEVVSPTMGEQSHAISIADFHYSESDKMLSCPMGQTP
jgi:hypothetical protein